MRTEERWEKEYRAKFITAQFTPRICNDMKRLQPEIQAKPVESTFIFGRTNTGKTIRAVCMALQESKYCYIKGLPSYNLLFASFPEMLSELRETYNGRGSEKEVMSRYLKVRLLILDDFLTVRPSDWVVDVLYWLINYRYEYQLKTVITSNHSLQEIEEILQDQRITSRIDRMCVLEEKSKVYKVL